MINLRRTEKKIYSFERYGFEIVQWKSPHDFCIRNVTAKPGKFEVFEKCINSNYAAIRVLPDYNVDEVREALSNCVWVKEDFYTCTTLNFWDSEILDNALKRNYEKFTYLSETIKN